MNKFKILPSILMLVLCVGVLAVGVFAVAPTENTISGSITIQMSNQPLVIKCYLDEVKPENLQEEFSEVRAGIAWTKGIQNLAFDTASANIIDEVPERKLIMEITNPTTNKLMAYFTKDGDVAVSDTLKTLSNVNVADVTLKGLTALDSESTIQMTITLKASTFVSDGTSLTASINYGLTIEEYKAIDMSQGTTTTDKIVAIPAPAEGATAEQKTVAENAFKNNKNIQAVIIPEGITTIGSNAFSGCSNLSTITIPNTVTTLSSGAFSNCTNLTEITIPDTVTQMDGAFGGCTFDKVICNYQSNDYDLVDGTIYVKKMTYATSFDDASNPWDGVKSLITGIDVADNIEGIGATSFEYCNSLKTLVIPENIKYIYGGNWGDSNGFDYLGAFSGCSNLKTVICNSDNLLGIDSWAFYYCTSLEEIIIKSKNVSIETWAFANNPNIKTATIYGTVLNYSIFTNSNVETLNAGSKVVNTWRDPYAEGYIRNTNLLEGVEEFNADAFWLENIEFLRLPSTLKKFHVAENTSGMYGRYYPLKAIYVPKSVISIVGGTFRGCFSTNFDEKGKATTINSGAKIFVEAGADIAAWGDTSTPSPSRWDYVDYTDFYDYEETMQVVYCYGCLLDCSNVNDYLITNSSLSDYEAYVASCN